MLYQFLLNFVDTFSFLNVFKYITFRAGLSLFTSLIIVLLIGEAFINFFSNKKILNPIRDDGPEDHIVKKIGTPTMGGVIILFGLLVSVLFWSDLSNVSILFCIYIAVSFGLLGAFDDYKKIKYNNSLGISTKFKILSQIDLKESDALFISCTALPALSIIDQLEKKLNKIVLSSNQTLIWDSLNQINYKKKIEGFGKLFNN